MPFVFLVGLVPGRRGGEAHRRAFRGFAAGGGVYMPQHTAAWACHRDRAGVAAELRVAATGRVRCNQHAYCVGESLDVDEVEHRRFGCDGAARLSTTRARFASL